VPRLRWGPAWAKGPFETLQLFRAKRQAPAPDFTVPDLRGSRVQLRDFKGQVIVLSFWATWCLPTREVRVAGDGCAMAPERVARERSGNPKLRLARVPRLGEIVEVRTKLDHDSDTGLSLKGGVYVRERPEFFIKQVHVYFDRELVAHFTLTSAVSVNPIFRFPVRVPRPGVLRVVFANNEGRQWEISEPVRLAG